MIEDFIQEEKDASNDDLDIVIDKFIPSRDEQGIFKTFSDLASAH